MCIEIQTGVGQRFKGSKRGPHVPMISDVTVTPVDDLVLDALATYRLTRLVVEDEVTRPVRERVWATRPPHESRLGYLLTCPYCTSVWVGLGVTLARRFAPRAWSLAASTMALSGVVTIIEDRRQSW